MPKKFYSNYLIKDKPLRHALQHLEVTIIVIILLGLIIRKTYTVFDLSLFLIFTYLPDINSLSSIFFWHKLNPTAEVVYGYLVKFKFKEALSYATIHHKKLNRLIIHNTIAYPLLWFLLFGLLAGRNYSYSVVVATILGHLTFDLLDDVYQLKHINNWLWPIQYLLR